MLNTEQLAAVTARGNVCILSGAGTGKTETIASVIANRASLGVQTRRMFVATFTNKATHEMRERLSGKGITNMPWLGTFHANGYRIMRQFGIHDGRSERFRIMDEDVLLQAVGTYILPDKKKEPDFYSYMREDVSPRKLASEFLNAVSLMKGDVISPNECGHGVYPDNVREIFSKFPMLEAFFPFGYSRYEEMLRVMDIVDIADLIYLPVLAARENASIRNYLSRMFDLVVVDEHQDSCPGQREMAHILSEQGSLVTVGDDGQSIYGWRGADVSGIRKDSQAENTECVILSKNYRSTPGILALGTFFASQDEESLEKTLIASGKHAEVNKLPAVQSFFSDFEEMDAIARSISQRARAKENLSEIAVLCRSRNMASRMVNRLVREGIPTVSDSLNIWEAKEVRFILAWIKMMLEPQAASNTFLLQDTVRSGLLRYGLGETWVSRVSKSVEGGVSFCDAIEDGSTKSALFRNHFSKMLEEFESITVSGDYVIECIECVLKVTGLEQTFTDELSKLKESGAFKDEKAAETLSNRIEKLKELRTMAQGESMDDFIEQSILGNTSSTMDEAVRVMTFHASKGLEWDTVYLMGFTEGLMGTIPGAKFGEACRMAYVASTRARLNLHISHAMTYHGKSHSISSILNAAIRNGLVDTGGVQNNASRDFKPRRQENNSYTGKMVIPKWMQEKAEDSLLKELRRLGGQ